MKIRYAKTQGHPIRMWAVLHNGKLKLKIHDGPMTSEKYVKQFVEKWIPKALRQMGVPANRQVICHLIQDHERAIRTQEVKVAMKKKKIRLDEGYPVASPDLNVYHQNFQLYALAVSDIRK
jgi:hypothetical protein